MVFELVKMTPPVLSLVLIFICMRHSVVLKAWASERLPNGLKVCGGTEFGTEVVQREKNLDHFNVVEDIWERRAK